MYESFYSLDSDPFRLLPDPEVCFPHRSCAKAWAYLRYALKRGEGIVVVTGPPGSGKTTLAERLLNELNPAKTVSVRLIANELNPTDLLRKLAYSFGLPAEGMDRAMLAHSIERYLIELEHSSRQALVLIDEAQTLSHQSLEAMRLLTDLQSRSRPVLQLFLLGQEELEGVMSAPGMAQFQQRVIASSKLQRMNLAETKAYLEYRLGFANWRGDPTINGPAVLAVYRSSRGLPRHINKICSRLLLHGCTEEKHALKQRDVMAVVQDLRHELLAPMENEPEVDVDLGDSPFDSVYELALVPAPRPVTTPKSTRRDEMTALFLADDPTPQAEPGRGGSIAGVSPRNRHGHYARGRHYYRVGNPRRFGFRRRIYHLLRLPRVAVSRGWTKGAQWVPSIRDFMVRLFARGRVFGVRAGEQLRVLLNRLVPGMRGFSARLSALPRRVTVGLAGVLVAAAVVALWSGDDEIQQPVVGNESPEFKRGMLSYFEVDGPGRPSLLEQPTRYLDVAELPVGEADFVSSALSAERTLRQGMIEADVADHRSLMSSDPGQLLLGRMTANAADGVIEQVAQAATTLDVWSLANRVPDRPGTDKHGVSVTGVARSDQSAASEYDSAAARHDAHPGGSDQDDRIALIVSDESGVSLDLVRFLPAPASGGASAKAPEIAVPEPTASAPSSTEQLSLAVAANAGADDVRVSGQFPVLSGHGEELDAAASNSLLVSVSSAPVEEVADRPEQAEIDRLLRLADTAIDKNRLLMPRERAAYTFLQQVLKIDPANRDARSGMTRIVRRYEILAESALDDQDFENAGEFIERGLRVDRNDSRLLALRQELEDTVAEAEAAELAAAEMARMAMQPPKPKPVTKRKERSESSFSNLMRLVEDLPFGGGN